MPFPPWRELKEAEEMLLKHRAAGAQTPELAESLRLLIAKVEGSPDADEAICYHGALALVYEFDGKREKAIYHRKVEIKKIEYLHALARKNPGDRAGLVNYGLDALRVRRRILQELVGNVSSDIPMQPNQQLTDAVKLADYRAAEDALKRGADVNAVIDGWTPLFWATQEGHAEIVVLLLDAGADVNFSDDGGFAPLKQAVGESHMVTAEHLLLRGADVNHRCESDGGSTVLHTAAAYGLVEAIRLLLTYGADTEAVDDDGRTPYEIAIKCGEVEAAALLEPIRDC